MRKLVYLSGPITKNCGNLNFYQAAQAQIRLMQSGEFAVYNPMLSMANFSGRDLTWDDWLECDEAWIRVSDLVIRLPGESKGADRECDFARSIRIPVYDWDYFECLHGLYTHAAATVPNETKTKKRFPY